MVFWVKSQEILKKSRGIMDNNNSQENNNDNNSKDQNLDVKSYESISDRLKEIEDTVSKEDLNMEESLKLYEEAVNLGMKASQTIENNVRASINNNENSQNNQESDSLN